MPHMVTDYYGSYSNASEFSFEDLGSKKMVTEITLLNQKRESLALLLCFPLKIGTESES